jgi:hypothetical protein
MPRRSRRILARLGSVLLDRRTSVAQEAIALRQELIVSVGGEDNLSPQKLSLINKIVRSEMFLASLEAALLERDSLVDANGTAAIPLLHDQQAIADRLVRWYRELGWERIARPVPSIRDFYLRDGEGDASRTE